MTRSFENNYYEVLEVAPDAPQHEIHEAFQRAKRTYSVDSPALYSMFNQDEAQQLSKLIEEAFAILGNQTLRKAYDEKLKSKQTWTLMPGQHTNPNPAPTGDGWGDSSTTPEDILSGHTPPPPVKLETRKSEPSPFSRTPLSTYKTDSDFEGEIAGQQVFDGTFLKKVREYKNIELGQMSEATKVSRNYLMAIEANNFSILPAPVFVRGFIIQIARTLGLDSNRVAGSYVKLLKDSLPR